MGQWRAAAAAPEEWPAPPPGVVQVQINRNTGCLAAAGDPYAVPEVFMAGSEPTQACGDERPPGQEDLYQNPR